MSITVASFHLSDEEFLVAFHNCELPLASFRQGDHLRLTWLALHRQPFAAALAQVREGKLRFVSHHGAGQHFHETLTRAWATLLATHDEPSFAAFLQENETRLTPELLHRFWTPELLNSETARHTWLPPDREALPS